MEYTNEEELGRIFRDEYFQECLSLHIGSGSNLLFINDFNGVILHSQIKGISVAKETDDSVLLRIGAAEKWDDVVAYAVSKGWGGIENLSGIPGEVGAAAVQNIGAYDTEIKDVVETVVTYNQLSFEKRMFTNEECLYSYRDSFFKNEHNDPHIVTYVNIRLSKKPRFSVNYGNLKEELAGYGKNVQLVYGGGSIKKNGIYNQVMRLLKDNEKVVVEDGGVMPNPTVEKLREGVRIARENHVDFLLAVGGGSCCDYAKAVSVSVHCDEDPWEKYYIRFEEPDCEIVPVGCVLTMVGTGSEMNGGAVITNHDQKLKIGHVFGDAVMPKFAILNPKFTFTLPKKQMVAGIYDIFNHICEQYFSGEDDNTSDYISEALMKSVIHSSRIAIQNPEDYEARSNIMWAATWALNTLVSRGKSTDWMVHMLGQAVGAYTDATHGMTLSAVSLPYYRYIMPYGLSKFCRFAVNVWEVDPAGKADEQVAREGLSCMEVWMKELGLTMNLHELGATEEMLHGIANGTIIMEGGYKVLNHDEVLEILKNSL